MREQPLNVNDFLRMKKEKIPITALTAYESIFAGFLDEAGVDLILVGDSLGNVYQGRDTTLPVTMDEMIYHGEIVTRSVSRSFVVVDMPFMSFQTSTEEAIRNAGILMKKTNCKAVKLEGGISTKETIKRIVEIGIPAIGHIGLTPQSIHVFGGFSVQGRNDPQKITEDALAVEEAGAFAVVLEKIPKLLAKEISEKLTIPTIGIGAGPYCDGQILVTQDMLGLFRRFRPKFARRYADLADTAIEALKHYCDDVKNGSFPSDEESYD